MRLSDNKERQIPITSNVYLDICLRVEAAEDIMFCTISTGPGSPSLLCIWMKMQPLQPESTLAKSLCFKYNGFHSEAKIKHNGTSMVTSFSQIKEMFLEGPIMYCPRFWLWSWKKQLLKWEA